MYKSSPLFPFAAVVLSLCVSETVIAQVITPPRVHWIGPEAECDFPDIQSALDEVFDCGVFACPPGRNELRLSSNYQHSGQVVIDRTFDIRGGFDVCEGTATGLRANLQAPNGDSLFVVAPGSTPIDNEFRELSLSGGLFVVNRGGVIHMQPGNARLSLNETIVRNARANSGGGIYLSGQGNHLVLDNAQIFANSATEGGGIFCTNGGRVEFQSGFIDRNEASLSGGGVYLQAQCLLDGNTSGVNRQISENTVTDIQRGQGAGIFSLFSTIELGAVLSRTRIESNIVTTFEQVGVNPGGAAFTLHKFGMPGQNNRGGGVHLASSTGTFLNTWFRLNEAADGGAVSVVGSSEVLIDRTSGDCGSGAGAYECSVIDSNRARGGEARNREDDLHQEAGDGAAIFLGEFLGQNPTAKIQRTVVRNNRASCFEADSIDFTGECDFPGAASVGTSLASIFQAGGGSELQVRGILAYANDTGDDEDCDFGVCVKHAYLFRGLSLLASSTVSGNADMDAIIQTSPSFFNVDVVNSLIVDDQPDELLEFTQVNVGSCNLTNFADELNLAGNSIPIANDDEDPRFVNPDVSDPASVDFSIVDKDSPAVDRCDDAGGLVTLSYDIVGNPRVMNVGAITHGPGEYDAGAFEQLPDNFENNTTDVNVTITSDVPQQAALGEGHEFTITAGNSGRNSVSDVTVELDFDINDAILRELRGATAFDPAGNPVEVWDCDRLQASCQRLALITPGTVTAPIVATLEYGSSGAKQVAASVTMNDESLIELTNTDNQDADTVTVGPGADLNVNLISAAPREVMIGEPQLLIFNVQNLGPEPAEQARVHLTASGAQISFFGGNDWNCDDQSRQCVHSRPLAPSTTQFSSFTAEVRYDRPGTKVLIAQIMAVGGPGDPDSNNNLDDDFVVVLAPPTDALFADSFEVSQ